MKATFGDPKYYKTCGSLFGSGTPMENDANTGWFKDRPELREGEAALQGSRL